MPSIRIANKSSIPIECFISKYNGGNDEWFKIDPGHNDTWNRNGGWELVAFRRLNSGNNAPRAGAYISVDEVPLVEFYDFGDEGIRLTKI